MFIVDLSFDWYKLPGPVLLAHGVTHVLAYAGCPDRSKNVSKPMLHNWLDHGIGVNLIYENTETDDASGYDGGRAHGDALLAAAEQLGYDAAGCTLWAAVDRNVQSSELAHVGDYQRGFHDVIPVPGFYGNLRTLAYARQMRYGRHLWQSDSLSYSGGKVFPFAHLVQIYDAPEVRGIPGSVDYDRYQPAAGPLAFMGGTPMDGFTDADRATLARIDQNVSGLVSEIKAPSGLAGRLGANLLQVATQIEAAGHTDTRQQLVQLQNAILSQPMPNGWTMEDFADAVVADFAKRLGVAPSGPASAPAAGAGQ